MKTRTFIAVNLPAEIKNELKTRINEIKSVLKNDGVKWVNSENFHLTLHFLGYLNEKELMAVQRILDNEVKNISAFCLAVSGFGTFPEKNRARVLFVKCRQVNGDSLVNLQQSIGKRLKEIGMEIDTRPWQTHITFARLRVPEKVSLIEVEEIKEIKFNIDSIDLMKSELRKSGPIYTIIKKFLI